MVDVVAADDALREHLGKPLFDMLLAHEADAVIAPLRDEDGIDSLRLYRWQLMAVIPNRHELATSADHVTIDALEGCQLLLSPPDHASRRLVDQAFPLPVEPYYENASTESLLAYVEAGLGIAILPDDALWPSPTRVHRPLVVEQSEWHALHWRRGEDAVDERLAQVKSAMEAKWRN